MREGAVAGFGGVGTAALHGDAEAASARRAAAARRGARSGMPGFQAASAGTVAASLRVVNAPGAAGCVAYGIRGAARLTRTFAFRRIAARHLLGNDAGIRAGAAPRADATGDHSMLRRRPLLAAAALSYQDVGTKVAQGLLKPIGAFFGNQDLQWTIMLPFELPGYGSAMTIDLIYWCGVAIIAIFVLGACNTLERLENVGKPPPLRPLLASCRVIPRAALSEISIIGCSLPWVTGTPAGKRRSIRCSFRRASSWP